MARMAAARDGKNVSRHLSVELPRVTLAEDGTWSGNFIKGAYDERACRQTIIALVTRTFAAQSFLQYRL
jgi:hypothetical protein